MTITLDSDERTISADKLVTVETGAVHSFRNETDERSLVITEIRSPRRLRQVLPTLGGLAHDCSADAESSLQQALIADALDGNTVFVRCETLPDVAIGVLASIDRLAGYQGGYATYMKPAFWRDHVEQPQCKRVVVGSIGLHRRQALGDWNIQGFHVGGRSNA